MQLITYNAFLPALLGSAAPKAADFSYDPAVDASIANVFSTAVCRFDHSMQSSNLQLVNNAGVNVGSFSLSSTFFVPT